MYSKAEKSKIRKDFWTAFGQYMKPVPSEIGGRVNWSNYKTGVKHIFFRMEAAHDFASIGIEINHPDMELQQLFFEQFVEFKNLLQSEIGENWNWKLHHQDEFGKISSKIYTNLPNANVMDRNDWSKIITFLKPRIIALDAFWANMKPAFEEL